MYQYDCEPCDLWGGGSSLPGLREVTVEEFLQVNKGLMLAFHRDFVCGVPYGVDTFEVEGSMATYHGDSENPYYFQSTFGAGCNVAAHLENEYAMVAQGEVILIGNFYDVKLFEVVEG